MWGKDEAEAFGLIIPESQTIREVDFLTWAFTSFAKNGVHTVLDLGCGAGRIAIELSSKGYAVTGVDKFPAMLAKARQNAAERGVRLNLFRTPLEELRGVAGRFDAAYSIQGPFSYVLTDEDLARSLARVNTLLRPGGIVVIDVMNFPWLYGKFRPVLTTARRGNGWSVRTVVTSEVDEVNMLWHRKEANQMKLKGRSRQWNEIHVFRMWTFPEFRRQLLASGFTGIRLFGRPEVGTEEATTQAPRLVIVAERSA